MRTEVAIVRDHSGSMSHLAYGAINDFNLLIEGIKNSKESSHNIWTTIVQCGVGCFGKVVLGEFGKPIEEINHLTRYITDGSSTPLFESIWTAIDKLEQHAKICSFDPNEAYLVMIITDGLNNAGSISANQLARRIQELQATDKWTFVFRVPLGSKLTLVRLGFHEGNIMEWEQTSAALEVSTRATVSSTKSYFVSRSAGITSTNKFYTNLTNVPLSEVKSELEDITTEVRSEPVWIADDGIQIRDFCNKHFGGYKIGCGYYQLTKPEKVQASKKIIVKHKETGKYYSGYNARQLLMLPNYEIKVYPGDHDKYEIYIQSSSVNRKLLTNTKVIYWDNI